MTNEPESTEPVDDSGDDGTGLRRDEGATGGRSTALVKESVTVDRIPLTTLLAQLTTGQVWSILATVLGVPATAFGLGITLSQLASNSEAAGLRATIAGLEARNQASVTLIESKELESRNVGAAKDIEIERLKQEMASSRSVTQESAFATDQMRRELAAARLFYLRARVRLFSQEYRNGHFEGNDSRRNDELRKAATELQQHVGMLIRDNLVKMEEVETRFGSKETAVFFLSQENRDGTRSFPLDEDEQTHWLLPEEFAPYDAF